MHHLLSHIYNSTCGSKDFLFLKLTILSCGGGLNIYQNTPSFVDIVSSTLRSVRKKISLCFRNLCMAVKDGLGPAGRLLIMIMINIIVIIIIRIRIRIRLIKSTFIIIVGRLLQLVVPQNTRGLCRSVTSSLSSSLSSLLSSLLSSTIKFQDPGETAICARPRDHQFSLLWLNFLPPWKGWTGEFLAWSLPSRPGFPHMQLKS